MIVILYTYALTGMQVSVIWLSCDCHVIISIQLFGQIEVASIDKSATNAIHQYNNFGNFPQAMLVMIRYPKTPPIYSTHYNCHNRCFTGENWQQIMLSSVSASCASNSVNNNTVCGSNITYFFYPSFFFVSSILVSISINNI